MPSKTLSSSEIESQLPSPSSALESLNAVIEHPEASFEDVASVVESVPLLAQRLLKLANSSFYGYPIPVSNIPEALSVVGLSSIRNLSIALLVPDELQMGPGFPVQKVDFWRYSVAVGLCARLMAIECREANTERHFIAGFFHKIGRPLFSQICPNEAQTIFQKIQAEEAQYSEMLQTLYGIDESQIAASCLRKWNFPNNLTNLVRFHNKPVLARQNIRGVSLVHLASFIVSALNIGDSGDRFVPEFSEAAWNYAVFEYSKLSVVVSELTRQLDDVYSVFQLEAS